MLFDVVLHRVWNDKCLFAICKICNADTLHTLACHTYTLNMNCLQLAIYHQLFSKPASYSYPHSLIWLHGLVAADEHGAIAGDNLSRNVESSIFQKTGCNNNLLSRLIERSYHTAPANISSSGLQMESRPKYYGREWVSNIASQWMTLFSVIAWRQMCLGLKWVDVDFLCMWE